MILDILACEVHHLLYSPTSYSQAPLRRDAEPMCRVWLTMMNMHEWTLNDVARLLGEPQHRLTYPCEKGSVQPDLEDAKSRGGSRRLSPRHLLEFDVALRLRELEISLQRRRPHHTPGAFRERGPDQIRCSACLKASAGLPRRTCGPYHGWTLVPFVGDRQGRP
jgi:hypothetical protein